MMQRTFPHWAGPLVGSAAGAWFGVRAAANPNRPLFEAWIIVGGFAAVGMFAGSLVALLDPQPRQEEWGETGTEPQRTMSVVQRFILLLAVTMCWLPFLGAALAVVGLLATRGRTDWLRTLSYAAVAVTVIVHGGLLVLFILEN